MRSFVSTRGQAQSVSAKAAIWRGLAPDGGLYVPADISDLKFELDEFANLSYTESAALILGKIFDDYTPEEIAHATQSAYEKTFTNPAVTPLQPLGKDTLLELYHGPTSAFKDVALTLLPYLLTAANPHDGKQTTYILTATSGDTGKAALEGFADVPGTFITVFYPAEGVSRVQEKQMRVSTGKNTQVIALEGNFDDCQRLAKECARDEVMTALGSGAVQLSSANSINAGRLFPQVVYYFRAFSHLRQTGQLPAGQTLDVVVPSGNFGNILAGYYAKLMGCPIGRLVCASNRNNVLSDFINTGEYNRNRPLHKTSSPSMDILISSNLERLLFLLTGQDTAQVRAYMDELEKTGKYRVNPEVLAKIQENFLAYSANEDECAAAINTAWHEEGILIDPHTAVAYHAARQLPQGTLILSTASAYKFPRAVLSAITKREVGPDDFAGIKELYELTGVNIPSHLARLASQTELHNLRVSARGAKELVAQKILELAGQ
ncbi:threonine synthase [Actinomycetaceae bacterium TAE3-ERU4]|nr:threonine synthase [Actinomycetaceae bacterium TAE3-ERU4]